MYLFNLIIQNPASIAFAAPALGLCRPLLIAGLLRRAPRQS